MGVKERSGSRATDGVSVRSLCFVLNDLRRSVHPSIANETHRDDILSSWGTYVGVRANIPSRSEQRGPNCSGTAPRCTVSPPLVRQCWSALPRRRKS